MKSCPKLTRDLNDPQKLDRLRAHIECQQPTVNLYQFVGTLTVYRANFEVQNSEDDKGGVTSLGLDNLLLRGARLKDTDYVYGIVVFLKNILCHLKNVEFLLNYLQSAVMIRMRCVYRAGYETRSQLAANE